MSTIKHQEGEATLSGETLTITFSRWTAAPVKKQYSPLVLPLQEIFRIEQQLTKHNERYLRIVTPGYVPATKPMNDPHVLHFLPIGSGYTAEIASFVDALEHAVNSRHGTHRGNLSGCLVEVKDIKKSQSGRAKNDLPAETWGAAPHQPPTVPRYRYNPPPNWPTPPPGWTPAPDWRPDPAWGPPPEGWPLWTDLVAGQAPPVTPRPNGLPVASEPVQAHTAWSAPQQTSDPTRSDQTRSDPKGSPPAAPRHERGMQAPHVDTDIGMFGARSKAKELAAEVNRLTEENTRLNAELARLGVLEIAEIEKLKRQLEEDVSALRAAQTAQRDQAEIAHKAEASRARAEMDRLGSHLSELRRNIVITEDLLALQEAGVYEYSHPLDDSVAYRTELAKIKDELKTMNRKDGGAVQATSQFTMNGSFSEGRKMVNEFSKLLLRAYNNEADNLTRGMKAYKLASSIDRLDKTRSTVEKLGQSMDIRISHAYHKLRRRELSLTADHLNKVAEEKEREREEKRRLREERLAQAELEREKSHLEKERKHYENALNALEVKGDSTGAERLREQLENIDQAMTDVDNRAANVRAGYVYVISNLGSFGERMIKVGMTRRLEPMDRVRELSDASVPFNFDVHAIHFSDDAVGVEAEMHRRLADKRVNRVNHRREFFYATPAEVRDLLSNVAGDLLQYDEVPEAAEYRQSAGGESSSNAPGSPS